MFRKLKRTENEKPERVSVIGEAGADKSLVINALRKQFMCKDADPESATVILAALTTLSVSHINGSAKHKAVSFFSRSSDPEKHTRTMPRWKNHIWRNRNTPCLILDERSFMKADLLCAVHKKSAVHKKL